MGLLVSNVFNIADLLQVQNMTSWDLSYYLLRANFDGVRSEYCDLPPPHPDDGKAVHLHDHNVIDVAEEGDGVKVTFKNSKGGTGSISGDLVVAADGPGSTTRSLFLSQVERKYAGYCALRGTVPEEEATDAAREVSTAHKCSRLEDLLIRTNAQGIPRALHLLPWSRHSNSGVHNSWVKRRYR